MSEQARMQVLINDFKDLGFFDEVLSFNPAPTLRDIAGYMSAVLVDGEMNSNRNPCKFLMDEDGMKAIENGNLSKVMVYLFPQHVPD